MAHIVEEMTSVNMFSIFQITSFRNLNNLTSQKYATYLPNICTQRLKCFLLAGFVLFHFYITKNEKKENFFLVSQFVQESNCQSTITSLKGVNYESTIPMAVSSFLLKGERMISIIMWISMDQAQKHQTLCLGKNEFS